MAPLPSSIPCPSTQDNERLHPTAPRRTPRGSTPLGRTMRDSRRHASGEPTTGLGRPMTADVWATRAANSQAHRPPRSTTDGEPLNPTPEPDAPTPWVDLVVKDVPANVAYLECCLGEHPKASRRQETKTNIGATGAVFREQADHKGCLSWTMAPLLVQVRALSAHFGTKLWTTPADFGPLPRDSPHRPPAELPRADHPALPKTLPRSG